MSKRPADGDNNAGVATKRQKRCPHAPPYGKTTPVDQALKEHYQRFQGSVLHFKACHACQQCDYKYMLECAFCPWTRPPGPSLAGEIMGRGTGGSVTRRWINPLACRTPMDVCRNGELHTVAARGWHSFWFAVHQLEHIPRDGTPADHCVVEGCQHADVQKAQGKLLELLHHKRREFSDCKDEFERAGLLTAGGVGDEYAVRQKFDQASTVLERFKNELSVLPRTTKLKIRKGPADEQSRAETPDRQAKAVECQVIASTEGPTNPLALSLIHI